MSQLVMQNLTKTFQGIPAVEDLWLQVNSGEIVSLLGPSGCGKSTTLQLIAGILRPYRGIIELEGRVLNRVPPEKRGIALVLQKGLLFPHLSVGENVAFGLKMRGESKAVRHAKALDMLKQVQLEGFAERKASALSGGQAQRVALARALVIQPKVLLLDEPLSALDANLREEMQELVLTLQAREGVTMLVVTHDQAEAVVMSHRIALMFNGRLRQVGSPEEFYKQPCDEATAKFFGGVNFFPAQADNQQLRLASGLVLMSEQPHQGPVQVTIRPEQIHVSPEPLPWANVIPATITTSRFTGTQWRLTLKIERDLTLQAWLPPTQTLAVGQQVWAHVPPPALWCFASPVLREQGSEIYL